MHTSEFDTYIIYHEEKPGSPEKAVITCFYDDRTVGFITFYDGVVPGPEVLAQGILRLSFHHGRFKEIIDTIRYEKPLYLSIYKDKSVVSTTREPVGEQEGH